MPSRGRAHVESTGKPRAGQAPLREAQSALYAGCCVLTEREIGSSVGAGRPREASLTVQRRNRSPRRPIAPERPPARRPIVDADSGAGDPAFRSTTLTFVFVLAPTEFTRWRARTTGPRDVTGDRRLATVVVNERHGVDPTHSVMLEVTGSADAVHTFAQSVAIDTVQRGHLRRRLVRR
jgi:hypothetical protein